jgi:hypothetical protein
MRSPTVVYSHAAQLGTAEAEDEADLPDFQVPIIQAIPRGLKSAQSEVAA